MPPPIRVELVHYDAAWPAMAADLMGQLRALGEFIVDVHHIGSTSVPGLSAKPIIDLMPVVTGLPELDRRRSDIISLGFEWHGELGMAGRRYCTLNGNHSRRIAQLHFFEEGSPHVVRHLAFRDYLRAHPETARAYEEEKRRARDLHPDDSHAYTDEKDGWIREIEAKALIWYGARGH